MQKKRTVIDLVDDLDGGIGATTVVFGLDGKTFEIELNTKNEARLRRALAPFVERAREARPRRRKRQQPDPAQVREWASEQGLEVNSHGRVPQAIVEGYVAAHGASGR